MCGSENILNENKNEIIINNAGTSFIIHCNVVRGFCRFGYL
jgi:hypothetical protein